MAGMWRTSVCGVGAVVLGLGCGLPATATLRDNVAPKLRALDSRGTVGGVTSLRYVVSDNSGRTWEELSIYQDGSIARRYRTTLGPALVGRMYGYRLDKTPASFRGTFAFCIQSHDATGNVSPLSCATVAIS